MKKERNHQMHRIWLFVWIIPVILFLTLCRIHDWIKADHKQFRVLRDKEEIK